VLEACRLGDAVAAAGHMQAHLTHTYALRLPMFAEAKPKMPTDAI
jgi:DNA-binding GntR family transcriptional regulator